MVIKPQWDCANTYYEGFARVKKEDRYGVIDNIGNMLIYPKWGNVRYVGKSLFIIGTANKVGLMNTKGAWLIKPSFNRLSIPLNGLVLAEITE